MTNESKLEENPQEEAFVKTLDRAFEEGEGWLGVVAWVKDGKLHFGTQLSKFPVSLMEAESVAELERIFQTQDLTLNKGLGLFSAELLKLFERSATAAAARAEINEGSNPELTPDQSGDNEA